MPRLGVAQVGAEGSQWLRQRLLMEERTMVRILTRTLARSRWRLRRLPSQRAGRRQANIGSNQHFAGLVNGRARRRSSTPSVRARSRQAAPDRSRAVRRFGHASRRGHGYTGPFTQIYAWFVPQSATTTAPKQLKFISYSAPRAIPTSVQVPCDGTGKVEFSSCPYLAPCAFGWIPDYVTVQFVNIAV